MSWRPATRLLSIITPMIGEAPVATWAQTSATTAGWFSWFLPLLAWLTSTMIRGGRPAFSSTWAAAATLAAS